ERLIAIGSPRFDRYVNARAGAFEKGKQLFTQLGLDTKRKVLLITVPFSDVNTYAFDSYQLAEFFEAIHTAQSVIPGIQVLFKFRRHECDGATREYLQELFITDYAIAGSEELFPLLCASDAVVSGNSTVIYETMLAQKPLVLYPWKSFDTYNARVCEPAAPLARTAREAVQVLARIFADASYREELMERQKCFIKRYSFDGKSSARMGEFIRGLLQKQK
ncbi:MAG: CDP-glycerol glycerophosphotransferase family protein, partial [bacterium]|nr:CDP-glycerol glycerophosphotransferase family protein [bacterium]